METDTGKYEVSVILTLFNSRKIFKRALNSVLNQTFKNYELIIIDDGSTDETEHDLFQYLKDNSHFKYIKHSNRKHPLSLNAGIINSAGKFITFIDSDDEYKPTHLEQRVSYFLKNPEVDLIHSPASLIGDEEDFYVPDVNDNSKLIHLKDCIIGGTLFGKKRVFDELSGFRNIYSHDSDFYNRAVKRFKVKLFDSPTYVYYRNNSDSVISKLKAKLNEH